MSPARRCGSSCLRSHSSNPSPVGAPILFEGFLLLGASLLLAGHSDEWLAAVPRSVRFGQPGETLCAMYLFSFCQWTLSPVADT